MPHLYMSAAAARAAVDRHSMFNIIQPRSGLKVDVIVPSPSDFNRSRFARVRRVRAGDDWDAVFSSPEDAILKKIKFHRAGGSDKHLRDVASVLRASGGDIDLAYVDRWAGTLGLTDIWREILDRLREP